MGQPGLEEHRVDAVLRVEQWHVAIHLREEVDAVVPLLEVRVIGWQRVDAAGAAEGPPWRHLEGSKQQS